MQLTEARPPKRPLCHNLRILRADKTMPRLPRRRVHLLPQPEANHLHLHLHLRSGHPLSRWKRKRRRRLAGQLRQDLCHRRHLLEIHLFSQESHPLHPLLPPVHQLVPPSHHLPQHGHTNRWRLRNHTQRGSLLPRLLLRHPRHLP